MLMIQVNDLCKNYGTIAVLKNINFSVESGEFVSIMGPSGSGKSTLLYVLSGIEAPTSGTVYINGKNVHAGNDTSISSIRCKDIGFVFQFYNLVPNLTVWENIMIPAVMAGHRQKEMSERVKKLLEMVELSEKKNAFPHELSGGQQQRVAVARAVINRPAVILADEPTGNLDSKSGTNVMELLSQINREDGTTIVQITHNPEMTDYGNRTIHIRDGMICND